MTSVRASLLRRQSGLRPCTLHLYKNSSMSRLMIKTALIAAIFYATFP